MAVMPDSRNHIGVLCDAPACPSSQVWLESALGCRSSRGYHLFCCSLDGQTVMPHVAFVPMTPRASKEGKSEIGAFLMTKPGKRNCACMILLPLHCYILKVWKVILHSLGLTRITISIFFIWLLHHIIMRFIITSVPCEYTLQTEIPYLYSILSPIMPW